MDMQVSWLIAFYIIDAQRRKGALTQFADNAGPDQPVDLPRLILALVFCLQNQCILSYMSTNRECPDQNARMCTFIWTFAVQVVIRTFSHIVHHVM